MLDSAGSMLLDAKWSVLGAYGVVKKSEVRPEVRATSRDSAQDVNSLTLLALRSILLGFRAVLLLLN